MVKEPPVFENNGLDAPKQTADDTGILWASRVAALQKEREAYEKRGMDDRVQAVDDELKRLGYRPGAGDVAEDTRSVPVAETSRALPKEEPTNGDQSGEDQSSGDQSSQSTEQTSADQASVGESTFTYEQGQQ